jgi:hypothetical protein
VRELALQVRNWRVLNEVQFKALTATQTMLREDLANEVKARETAEVRLYYALKGERKERNGFGESEIRWPSVSLTEFLSFLMFAGAIAKIEKMSAEFKTETQTRVDSVVGLCVFCCLIAFAFFVCLVKVCVCLDV